MANPTRRIYVTDAEEAALQRVATAAEFSGASATPEDVETIRKVLGKLKAARR